MIILFLGSIMLVGCKNKKNAEDPTKYGDLAPGSGINMQNDQQGSKTQVATGDMRELLLSLSRVHFGLDSSTLVPQARNELDDASEKLKKYPDVRVKVEGHTDERGTTEHNMALGERRANAVVKYLVEHGVSQEQLEIMSLGEEKPRAEGSGVRELAENRRVEFQLMKGDIELVLEEGMLFDDNGVPLDNSAASDDESGNQDEKATALPEGKEETKTPEDKADKK